MALNSKVDELKGQITPCLGELLSWLTNGNLQLSADKSSSTIFATWTMELSFDPKLEINRVPSRLKSKPRLLGVVFNGLLSFNEQFKTTTDKLQKRNFI